MDVGTVLRELRTGGWKIFAVLFLVSAGIVAAAKLFPSVFPEPFAGLIAGCMFVALGSGIALMCYGAAFQFGRIADATKRRNSDPSPATLRRRFAKQLTAQQRQFLIQIYRTGQRRFEWRHDRLRWLEELDELGFIEWISPVIIWAEQPDTYNVTVGAWKAIQELETAGKLA